MAPGAGRTFVMESTDGSGGGSVCVWALCSPVTFFFVSSGSQEYVIVVNGVWGVCGWGGVAEVGRRLITRDMSVVG